MADSKVSPDFSGRLGDLSVAIHGLIKEHILRNDEPPEMLAGGIVLVLATHLVVMGGTLTPSDPVAAAHTAVDGAADMALPFFAEMTADRTPSH